VRNRIVIRQRRAWWVVPPVRKNRLHEFVAENMCVSVVSSVQQYVGSYWLRCVIEFLYGGGSVTDAILSMRRGLRFGLIMDSG
jgi:hypothetical protein